MQDAGAHAIREAAWAGPSAAGVCQSRCACLPITKVKALHMPWRNVEQLRLWHTPGFPLHRMR